MFMIRALKIIHIVNRNNRNDLYAEMQESTNTCLIVFEEQMASCNKST